MAQTQMVSESRADQLIARWMGELDALYAAGDTEQLAALQSSYAVQSAQFIADDKLAPAARFASLALHARKLLELPPRPRILRRPASVTEALMERDV